jgi:LacI family transcriptional regulator
VLRAASALGIRCPEELSLVGFDDQEVAALVTPALTTVRVPMIEMGRQAVRQLMIQIMRGPEAGALGCRVRLMPELVIRQSTAPVSL